MNYSPSRLARIVQLATHFELQNFNLNAKDCAKHINEVDHPKEAFLSNHTIAASAIQALEDDCHYYITIEHQYREGSGWCTSARLDGELMRGANSDATVAVGVAEITPVMMRRVVIFSLLGLGAMWLFGGIPAANFLAWFTPFVCFGVAGYHFWTGFTDRNSLLSAIDYLMTEAHSFSPKYSPVEDNQMREIKIVNSISQVETSNAMSVAQPAVNYQ